MNEISFILVSLELLLLKNCLAGHQSCVDGVPYAKYNAEGIP